ncbi:MAG: TorF family putative porin [Alphaproteobacteria bacterium]
MTRCDVMLAAACLIPSASFPAKAQAQDSGNGIASTITLSSDYRYEGFSSSDGRPVVQANVHHFRTDGWHAGLFTSQVDFNDGSTSYELNIYAGKTVALDPATDLTLEGSYTAYPDNETPGPSYDYLQASASVTRRIGSLTWTSLTTYVPEASYGTGQSWHVESEAVLALSPGLSLRALAGRRWIEIGPDRNYWKLGATASWKALTFEILYQDTNLPRAACGNLCKPSVTGQVTFAFPLILF